MCRPSRAARSHGSSDGGRGPDGVLLGASHEPDAPGSWHGEIIAGGRGGRPPKAAGPAAF